MNNSEKEEENLNIFITENSITEEVSQISTFNNNNEIKNEEVLKEFEEVLENNEEYSIL